MWYLPTSVNKQKTSGEKKKRIYFSCHFCSKFFPKKVHISKPCEKKKEREKKKYTLPTSINIKKVILKLGVTNEIHKISPLSRRRTTSYRSQIFCSLVFWSTRMYVYITPKRKDISYEFTAWKGYKAISRQTEIHNSTVR